MTTAIKPPAGNNRAVLLRWVRRGQHSRLQPPPKKCLQSMKRSRRARGQEIFFAAVAVEGCRARKAIKAAHSATDPCSTPDSAPCTQTM